MSVVAEPPRRSRAVDLVMAAAQRTGAARITPHIHGGSVEDKIAYEERFAYELFEAFGGRYGLDVFTDRDVLDVGCGWGGKDLVYAREAAPRSIHGFDLPGIFDPEAPAAVARERGLGGVHFTTGLAEDIPFADERFDVVLMEDVLEHVADPARVLAECRRVLRPGGLVLAKFPSIRMASAHHLDRAVTWPGLHYLLPLRTWAAGLNDWRARHGAGFEPFDRVVRTPYHPAVTGNLNGMDFDAFSRVVAGSGLRAEHLEIVPTTIRPIDSVRRAAGAVHRLACRSARLRELLGTAIAFAGRRPE